MLFINEVNVGRYWSAGPQRTLYIPAPLLRRGVNKVRRPIDCNQDVWIACVPTANITHL